MLNHSCDVTDKAESVCDLYKLPEGYALVPVEPTKEMMLHNSESKHHAWDGPDCPTRETRRLVWGHMSAAVLKGGLSPD